MNKINPQCELMARVNIVGDQIPPTWYKYLKIPNRPSQNAEMHKQERVDFYAIAILGECVYWYRPTVVRDEATGNVTGLKQKFNHDKLKKTYQSIANHFGFDKRQTKEAMDRLEDLGLITREFRTMTAGETKVPNVMFIEINAKAVEYISNIIPTEEMTYATTQDILRHCVPPHTPLRTTKEEITKEITKVELYSSTSNSLSRITQEQDLDIQGNDNSNILGPQNSTADELRNKAKDVDLPTKPEPEPYKCPSTVQPFIDLWKTITGRGYRKDDVYRNDCLAIQKLIHGKFFNKKNTPDINPEYYDTKLTLDDWEFVLQRFVLIRNNANYWPKNKATLSALTISRFLYNGFSKEKKSYFIECLENEPKLLSSAIKAKPLNDPTPHYTNFLINILKEKLEWDLDNGNRAKAIDAVTKLNSTFERLEPKIINYGYFCGDFYKRAKLLVEMFESHQDRGIPIRPEYINTDKTHSIFIPEYMERVGLIKS